MEDQSNKRTKSDLKFVLIMTLAFFVLPLVIIAIPGVNRIGDWIVQFMMNAIDMLDLSQKQ